MEEISRARKVEGIHAARLGRVLEEPGIDEPQVVIRVRHIDLGVPSYLATKQTRHQGTISPPSEVFSPATTNKEISRGE